MTEEFGKPIAFGRTAEIYAFEEGWILKVFHDWFDLRSIQYEARIAGAVYDSGLPVPQVGPVLEIGERHGLVYRRVNGISMLKMLAKKPWKLFRFARRMAELHAQMHAIPAPPRILSQRERLAEKIASAKPLSDPAREKALAALQALPEGDRLCHGDFHPDNIMIAGQKEVIIDWIDATSGSPLADAARTTIILLGAAESAQVKSPGDKAFVRLFHKVYLRRYFRLRPGGEAEYRRWLPVVAAGRLNENIPELEEWLVRQANQ